jgi:protease I
MAEDESTEEPKAAAHGVAAEDVDEYGLKVQRYVSLVLVIVPTQGFAETTLRYARSSLYNVHVGTRTVASMDDGLVKGEFQDEFQVDGPIAGETMEPYSGLILAAGPGAADLARDPDVVRLIHAADSAKKLLGTWGEGLGCLLAAGVVKGRRVTGDRGLADAVRKAGGKYSGVQVQRDGHLVTALDDAAGFRFGRELIRIVGIAD